MRTRFDIACTVEVEQSDAHFHAHVELDGDVAIAPGDRVRVHGAPIRVPFGGRLRERRIATVTRASWLERAWVRFRSRFEITELYEISWSAR